MCNKNRILIASTLSLCLFAYLSVIELNVFLTCILDNRFVGKLQQDELHRMFN